MKRRLAVIAAALSLATVAGTATASAVDRVDVTAKETNGCVIVYALKLVVCLPSA